MRDAKTYFVNYVTENYPDKTEGEKWLGKLRNVEALFS
jgi:hypothetical protein